MGTGKAGAKAAAAIAEKAKAEAAARAAARRYGRSWGQGKGGGGRYDGCHDGPTALEYGKLTCFPTRMMEVLQHHDSTWQPADIALSPTNRGSGGKNVIFSNGPNSTSECSKLLY